MLRKKNSKIKGRSNEIKLTKDRSPYIKGKKTAGVTAESLPQILLPENKQS